MKLIRYFLLIIHFFVLFLLLGTIFNSIVTPKVFPYFNLLSLSFPILIVLHVAFCFVWVILWKKRAFFFLVVSVFLVNPTKRWINFSPHEKAKSNLSIISYNVRRNSNEQQEIIGNFLKSQKNIDIIFLQESGEIDSFRPKTSLPYHYYIDNNLAAIYSKYKILNHGFASIHGITGGGIFVDIEYQNKIIRVVNVYLRPFFLNKNMVKPEEDYDENESKFRKLITKLVPNFKIHQTQVEGIQSIIKNSPYPVILCGDFNAVPNSYEYYALKGTMLDVFEEVGRGSATSFHDYKFPLRIDYVFCSKSIIPISYKVDRSIKLSDHFPVYATFNIK